MSEPRLFADPEVGRRPPEPVAVGPGERIVRVLPDVSGLDKAFDYLVPARWADRVAVGSLVRVDLHGRRVAAWVVEIDVEPPSGVSLRAITKLSSVGPPPEVVDLARWAAHRWAGRLTTILKTASPPTMVPAVAAPRPPRRVTVDDDPLVAEALNGPGVAVVEVGPAGDQFRFALGAAALGNALVVVPGVGPAKRVGSRLARAGCRVHHQPTGWAGGPGGGVVVGSRSAVWAPTAPLDAVVVLDEHDESLQEERVPTWHARDVAVERARRAGVPCVLVSPAPSLAALALADRVIRAPRAEQRRGWPAVEIVDRRDEEPGRSGLFSPRVAELLRDAPTAVAVLNRKGRAPMLACASCGELVRTENGAFLMQEVEDEATGGRRLVHPGTGESRPLVCAVCTGTTLKRLRLGVTRAAEELAALVGRPVTEVTAGESGPDGGGLVLGTEAALHRGIDPDVVVFLDFDQELHAPRYRAAEQALWLLVRAARIIGGRRPGGRLVVQTRSPDHRALRAALTADPGRMVEEERSLRAALGFPPTAALAEVGGAGAAEFTAAIRAAAEEPGGDRAAAAHTTAAHEATAAPTGQIGAAVSVLGPRQDGRYLVRAPNHGALADVLARTDRPKERVRIAVDPPRA
ncbi:MAG: hypothetical protein AAF547_00630 [Actinomycetota bacterium]